MAAGVHEINTYFGRCRCCLKYGYLKNMWEEHYFEGMKEMYVEMLVQCFALSWEPSEDSMEHDQICQSCVLRLRDAHAFKKEVMDSQEMLLAEQADESETIIKQEVDYTMDSDDIGSEFQNDPDDADESEYRKQHDTKYEDDELDGPKREVLSDNQDTEYEDVEYLEDEISEQVLEDPKSTERRTKSTSKIPPGRKWPQKLPKSERYKTYKQYTEEDLRKALAAVKKEKLTLQEASKKFNIPAKTLCAKAKVDVAGPRVETEKEKMYQLIREIKSILTYTNATPFKSKANRYHCAFCTIDFENADELRRHTRTDHVNDMTQKIDYVMRPHYTNETLKLDIDNLLCVVCSEPITSWNGMFQHLKEKHGVILDQAYTRVIPYILKAEIKCALCLEQFTNFMHVDGHMNGHYTNYVCDDCGDTFLAETRLKQHVKIHATGRFPCSLCDKVFTLEKYKKKHEAMVHKRSYQFGCYYCGEKFSKEYSKHLHMLEKHKEKVKLINCEYCDKTFSWRPYYIKHKKINHSVDGKKYICSLCPKRFLNPHMLEDHLLRHRGKKEFLCSICGQGYVSVMALKHHLSRHNSTGTPQSILECSRSNDTQLNTNDSITIFNDNDSIIIVTDGQVDTKGYANVGSEYKDF